MLKKFFTVFALISIATSSQAQSAKGPLQLKQTSAWNVDYADDRCRLMRQFGEGDDKVFAIFDRYGPGERFRITIAGKPVKTAVENGEATIKFGPVEGEQKLAFYKGNLGEYPALVFQAQARVAPPTPLEQSAIDNRKADEWIELASVGPEREGAIRNLTIANLCAARSSWKLDRCGNHSRLLGYVSTISWRRGALMLRSTNC